MSMFNNIDEERKRLDRTNPEKFVTNCQNNAEAIHGTLQWAASLKSIPLRNVYVGEPYPATLAPKLVGIWIK